MSLLFKQTTHQFQLGPISQKKCSEILFPLGKKTNQAVQMPTAHTA
jgi:hypothetical protein